MNPVVLWTAAPHKCVLCRVDGRYEVHLQEGPRTTRIETAASEAEARVKAAGWLRSLSTQAADT